MNFLLLLSVIFRVILYIYDIFVTIMCVPCIWTGLFLFTKWFISNCPYYINDIPFNFILFELVWRDNSQFVQWLCCYFNMCKLLCIDIRSNNLLICCALTILYFVYFETFFVVFVWILFHFGNIGFPLCVADFCNSRLE